jgi:hypothetical protein
VLSPQLERRLIDNLAALEQSVNLRQSQQQKEDNNKEFDGPKSVRMYNQDIRKSNNAEHHYYKMATCTINELSCESNSVEPSPKS